MLVKIGRNISTRLNGFMKNVGTLVHNHSARYASSGKEQEKGTDEIKIIKATKEHREDILRLMRDCFLAREPIESTLGVTREEAGASYKYHLDDCLNEPLTLVAMHPKEGAVGYGTSKFIFVDPDREPSSEHLVPVIGDAPKLRIYQHLVDEACKGWERTYAERGFSTALLFATFTADPRFGNRGLAQRMIQENIRLGQRLRPDCVFAYAVNKISSHIFPKLGYEVWRSIELEKQLNPKTGAPWVLPRDGTKAVQWKVKVLRPQANPPE